MSDSRLADEVARRELLRQVDIFVLKTRAFDQSSFVRTQTKELEPGELYPVASPEDTILHKLEWYRIGQEVSERQWKDVLGVIRVQDQRLDREYMKRWAAALGLEDLLSRALSDAGVAI